MLEDRDYMRAGDDRSPMTLTLKLTIAMVVVFALQSINSAYLNPANILYLALTPMAMAAGWVWQLVTFQFLHADLIHIILNLISFWFLGRFCEHLLGKQRMAVALIGCGIAGGILQGILMVLFPRHFGPFVVGASAGVSGLLAIFALIARDQQTLFFFLVPMRATVLLYIFGGISLFFTLVPAKEGGCYAHAAHLGGLLAGIAWIKLGWHHDYNRLPWERWMDAWRARRERRTVRLPRPSPAVASASAGGKTSAARKAAATTSSAAATAGASGPTEFISKEVDPILDKIAAHGLHSLTAEEKRILENARTRIEKR
jgi:membrane associated rhomboid family serine protease